MNKKAFKLKEKIADTSQLYHIQVIKILNFSEIYLDLKKDNLLKSEVKREIDYSKLKSIDATKLKSKQKEFVVDMLNENNLKKFDSTNPVSKYQSQNETQVLIKLMERDQVEKDMADVLKTTFLG